MQIHLALVLLGGCGSAPLPTTIPPESSIERAHIEAVVVAWNERDDLPAMDGDLHAMEVYDPPTIAAFREVCAPSWECLIHRDTGFMTPMLAVAVIYPLGPNGGPMSAGTRLGLIRHSAVHRAAELAGITDNDHHDRRLWDHLRPPGPVRDATVEARARAIANTH